MSDLLSVRWLSSPDQSDSRPVLIALHGLFGSASDWQDILKPCASEAAIGLVTLPGHGLETSDPSLFSMDAVAKSLGELLAPYPAHRRVLLGYSMGGRLSAFAALSGGVEVAALFLLSAHPGLESAEARWQRLIQDDRLAARVELDGLPSVLNEWYELPLFANDLADTRKREQFIARRMPHDPAGICRAIRGFSPGWQPDLRAALALTSARLVYLAGGRDTAYAKIAEELATLLPSQRVRILPGIGHDLPGEAADNTLLRDELRREIGTLLTVVRNS